MKKNKTCKYISKYLVIVLKEMCKCIGVDFYTVDFSSNEWFYKYSWTREQEKEFKKWLMVYIKENKEARKELMNIHYANVRGMKAFVDYFCFQYGWVYGSNERTV